jgi:hypothetical protein
MSITLDDKAVDVFKLYDEMTDAYSKDIEGYKAHIVAIEAMIAQKEEMLRDIKEKTVKLIKSSLEITVSHETSVRKRGKKFNYAGVGIVDLTPEKEIESGDAVFEINHSMTEEEQPQALTPPVNVQKPKTALNKKITGKGKVKRAEKPKKPAKRSKIIAEAKTPSIKKSGKPAKTEKEIKCLYHPESPAVDMQRQLCSSCRWKLRSNGLTEFDKDPSVVSFLKGETKSIPNVGQPMCPVHPEVPAYNKKTGLCQRCQSKAKAIGVTDRHLTEEELTVLQNPAL